jgi:hypothetical protein
MHLVDRKRSGTGLCPGSSASTSSSIGSSSLGSRHGYRAKHSYYYYPDSYVYFDVGRSLYFYYSGGGWQASVSLPSGLHIAAGEYVALEMDADRPYIYHSDVEKRYPPGQMKKKEKGDKGKGKKWD